MYSCDDADSDAIFLNAGGVYDVDDNNKLLLYNQRWWYDISVVLHVQIYIPSFTWQKNRTPGMVRNTFHIYQNVFLEYQLYP